MKINFKQKLIVCEHFCSKQINKDNKKSPPFKNKQTATTPTSINEQTKKQLITKPFNNNKTVLYVYH